MLELPGDTAAALNALIAAFAVLDGTIASSSGFGAAAAYWTGKPSEELAARINEGIAVGFTAGAPAAFYVITILGGGLLS